MSTADIGAICGQVSQVLPKQIDGADRRNTTPKTNRTAAWGDPPVILRCGVERPAALTATAQLSTVNGIDWLVEDKDGGHVFTTVGRAAYVQVLVPAAHDPQVGPLADLSTAMQYVPIRPEFYPPTVRTPKASAKPKASATPKAPAKPKR